MAYTVIADIGELAINTGSCYFRNVSGEPANPCVLMTLNNEVIFCGNITIKSGYTANMPFATLPDSMRPGQTVRIPVSYGVTTLGLVWLEIKPSGSMALRSSFSSETVILLSGRSFNASSRYYNPEIGNIYNNGTSPLSEV